MPVESRQHDCSHVSNKLAPVDGRHTDNWRTRNLSAGEVVSQGRAHRAKWSTLITYVHVTFTHIYTYMHVTTMNDVSCEFERE